MLLGPTYQHSPDRNAVFEKYSVPRDWSYDVKAKVNGGLSLVGNVLLFTTFSHKLVALDVRDGRELWHAGVPNIAMSTPIVAGNTVYIGTGKNGILERHLRTHFSIRNVLLRIQFGTEPIWGAPSGDEVAAFDLRTGALRWRYQTAGEDMPSAVYDGGRLIFANGDWRAYALRADTGKMLWSTQLGGVATMANAVQAGNAVVVGVCTRGMRESYAIALNPSDGKIIWRAPYGHCDASPAYARGKVFVSSLASGDTMLQGKTVVAALDARNGKPIWVYRSPNQGLWSTVASSEAAIAGTYAAGTYYQAAPFTDEFIAFEADTGKVRWSYRTSGPVKMSCVVMHGRVYFGDTAGIFYTLDARDGRLLEVREFTKPFSTSPPIIAGDKILVANGTSVDAIPLSGKPTAVEGVGWAVPGDRTRTDTAQ